MLYECIRIIQQKGGKTQTTIVKQERRDAK
nr:MAG TPA: hypothetical protein [Caudoviricetes sp.]